MGTQDSVTVKALQVAMTTSLRALEINMATTVKTLEIAVATQRIATDLELKGIKENLSAHEKFINGSNGDGGAKTDLALIKTKVDGIYKLLWVILTAVVGYILVAVLKLVIPGI